MDFKGYGNTLAKQKRKIINSLLYKKLLISDPFVISFLHVCFYVQYPIFHPFLTGWTKANNPLRHQTDVFVFKAKWNLMNFCSLPLGRCCQNCWNCETSILEKTHWTISPEVWLALMGFVPTVIAVFVYVGLSTDWTIINLMTSTSSQYNLEVVEGRNSPCLIDA